MVHRLGLRIRVHRDLIFKNAGFDFGLDMTTHTYFTCFHLCHCSLQFCFCLVLLYQFSSLYNGSEAFSFLGNCLRVRDCATCPLSPSCTSSTDPWRFCFAYIQVPCTSLLVLLDFISVIVRHFHVLGQLYYICRYGIKLNSIA